MLEKSKGKRKEWLNSITNSINMNLSKLWEILEDKGPWCPAVHRVRVRHKLVTEKQNQKKKKNKNTIPSNSVLQK